jgi:CDP-2,3-bis-(O-geranylgeranyl)-sn-glycerol synthase
VRDAGFHLLQLLYFMLPAYAANMAPPFVRYWPGWNRPINVRLLGAHKTVLGFALGVSVGLLATALQSAFATPLARVDYAHWPLLGLGFGVGAMLGDSIKSLFKRRLGIAPGARWFPLDQLDFVIGALALVGVQARLSSVEIAVILIVSLVGDLLVNRLAFWLRIKKTPW